MQAISVIFSINHNEILSRLPSLLGFSNLFRGIIELKDETKGQEMFQAVPVEATNLVDIPPPTLVRALLLDDSKFDRAKIRRLSQRTGLCVELDEVSSISEMDKAVAQERYDLILIDYCLPIGDGMQALERVLKNPQNKYAGKIMITGDNAQETAIVAMRGGCHDFLAKDSIDAEMLTQSMVNAISQARQYQARSAQFLYQRDEIKHGLIAAMSDDDVQGSLGSIVAQQLRNSTPDFPNKKRSMNPAKVDALLRTFSEEDQFVFH